MSNLKQNNLEKGTTQLGFLNVLNDNCYNLIKLDRESYTDNETTYTFNDDNTITINGGPNNSGVILMSKTPCEKNKSYIIKLDLLSGSVEFNKYFGLYLTDYKISEIKNEITELPYINENYVELFGYNDVRFYTDAIFDNATLKLSIYEKDKYVALQKETELEDGTKVIVENITPHKMKEYLNDYAGEDNVISFRSPGEPVQTSNGEYIKGIVQSYNHTDVSNIGKDIQNITVTFSVDKDSSGATVGSDVDTSVSVYKNDGTYAELNDFINDYTTNSKEVDDKYLVTPIKDKTYSLEINSKYYIVTKAYDYSGNIEEYTAVLSDNGATLSYSAGVQAQA